MRQQSLFLLLLLPYLLEARRFYDDDPLQKEPAPINVAKAQPRKVSDIYDVFSHILATPGEKHRPAALVHARDVNTLGEVLEGAWYEKPLERDLGQI
jgi:hypothetical protein